MVEVWDNCLKTPANDSLHNFSKFGPLFGYHNFQKQIGTWETTVDRLIYFFRDFTIRLKKSDCKTILA